MVRTAAPDLPVTRGTVIANPAAALVEASATADLVVLTCGGLGHAAGVILGAAAHSIAAHANCPVLLTPYNSEWSATGPVVVGIDASEGSVPAVEWAFAEASTRDAPLVVLHTWWWEEPDPFPSGYDSNGDWRDVVETQRLEVAEMLAGWQDKYPKSRSRPQWFAVTRPRCSLRHPATPSCWCGQSWQRRTRRPAAGLRQRLIHRADAVSGDRGALHFQSRRLTVNLAATCFVAAPRSRSGTWGHGSRAQTGHHTNLPVGV